MTDRAFKQAHSQAQDLLDFIDASPSPWHAVDTAVQLLSKQGYSALDESQAWQLKAGQGYYVVRGGASIIAFHLGQKKPNETGFRLVGAHTDSPGLRLKPKAAYATDDLIRIGVEVYGGPILATFTDRDLSVAGRISLRNKNGFDLRLVKLDQPMLRLPNLAIHMNREVNDKGLLLNKQTELPLIFGQCEAGVDAEQVFLSQLAQSVNANAADILSFELNVFDTQKGSFWGANLAFIANSQLDNLASCHAALSALLATEKPMATTVCALFDHEEVGSESATGSSQQLDDDARLQAMARSFLVSADMAHAYHPNHPSAYEPCHHVLVNHGPVIKTNANHRYASNADSSARFMQLCEAAGVPYQQYAHRSDLGCGSTIGPIVAANLGVPSVDVGSPMWAMHSLRESAGVLDHAYMIAVLSALYRS
jgi:aspartyl aminopeptidase